MLLGMSGAQNWPGEGPPLPTGGQGRDFRPMHDPNIETGGRGDFAATSARFYSLVKVGTHIWEVPSKRAVFQQIFTFFPKERKRFRVVKNIFKKNY